MSSRNSEILRCILHSLLLVAFCQTAQAGQKAVEELFAHTALIAQAIIAHCEAVAKGDEETYNDCWDAQTDAFVALVNTKANTVQASILLDCTADAATWEDVDWVKAQECML